MSEIASYAFCAKAWHLEHVRAEFPSLAARKRRDEGTEHHAAHGARHGRAHAVSATVVRAALLLLLAALAIITIGIALSVR